MVANDWVEQGGIEVFDYSELDPGIRETVRQLRDWGFDTTDSGDGHTKLAAGWSPTEALDIPHVIMSIDSLAEIAGHADELRSKLLAIGIEVKPVGEGVPHIQASYDPANGIASMALFGLDDNGL